MKHVPCHLHNEAICTLYHSILLKSIWGECFLLNTMFSQEMMGFFQNELTNILCIKRIVTYFILISIIDMVSKVMIKCLYEGDKLLSKVMTMFSFLTSTSKWFDLANVVQQIKPSCNLHVNKLLLMNQILDKLPIL